jgi:hypothetical protein
MEGPWLLVTVLASSLLGWAFAAWSWLERPAWQKNALIIGVPASWPGLVLLLKGEAGVAAQLLLLVPPACLLGSLPAVLLVSRALPGRRQVGSP